MGFFSRLMIVIRAKGNSALNRAEDPIQMLEFVDDQQREMLRRMKQGIIEVAISKRQLQQQVSGLEQRIPQLEQQAMQAMELNREDLARIALERKQTALAELEQLTQQVAGIEQEEQKLVGAEQRLAGRMDELKAKRRTLSARYTAAEAQVAVKEALAGVSGDFAELSMAVGRAEEKIEYMIARASAVDDLISADGITSLTGSSGDVVERELREITSRFSVDGQLKTLRANTKMVEAAKNGTGE